MGGESTKSPLILAGVVTPVSGIEWDEEAAARIRVAEIPSIAGRHVLTPTAAEAFAELADAFRMIEEKYRASGREMPRDTT